MLVVKVLLILWELKKKSDLILKHLTNLGWSREGGEVGVEYYVSGRYEFDGKRENLT